MIRNTLFLARPRSLRGFTLIELLTVVAVIGILASILVPVVGGANRTAKRAKSRAQYQGYATALVAYQSEYGYFPRIGTMASAGNSGNGTNLATTSSDFIKALSGRTPQGTVLQSGDLYLNPRSKPFYSFAESEFYFPDGADEASQTELANAFNNRDIYILVDSNGSGVITLPGNVATRSGTATTFRGKVAIWSLGPNASGNAKGAEDVFSWN